MDHGNVVVDQKKQGRTTKKEMSFYQTLKQIERFLAAVVGNIDPNHNEYQRNNGGNPQRFAPNVQNPAVRSLTRIPDAASTCSRVGAVDGTADVPMRATLTGSSNQGRSIVDDDHVMCSPLHIEMNREHDDLSSNFPLIRLPHAMNELSSEMDYMEYYSGLLDSLSATISESIIPRMCISNEIQEEFFVSIRQEMNARMLVQEAQGAVEAGAGTCPENGATSKAHLKDMEFLLQQTEEAALDAGSRVLNLVNAYFDGLSQKRNDVTVGTSTLVQLHEWDTDIPLLQCSILSRANPKNLASYAALGRKQESRVLNLLQNSWLMRNILLNDGPRQDKFSSMLDIYHDILAASHRAKNGVRSNDIVHRLALAVALEHAVPINIFDTNEVIDPIARFQHYENAHIRGELDPSFLALSVWELRMVVNNDASNDEIQWCRDMLRNYRPDHITERNDKWQYCMIVKSDVRYKRPEWALNCPRTYQQMLSGGGMCGPRAWFGRFVCKSFGIPTWGVRQPGHAAMSRWTPSGEWEICLGGPNWKKSYWGDRNGFDFEIETRARLSSDEYKKVMVLDCLAEINQEEKMGSQHRNYMRRNLNKRFWRELSRCQKRLLARCAPPRQVETKQMYDAGANIQGYCSNVRNDQITIPAAACRRPARSNGNVIFMKSFDEDGERHIHLRENGNIEYRLTIGDANSYLLHATVVTAHATTEPIKLKLVNNNSETNIEMKVPYTKGYWATTEPIRVDLKEGLNELHVCRFGGLGITIKEFILTRSD